MSGPGPIAAVSYYMTAVAVALLVTFWVLRWRRLTPWALALGVAGNCAGTATDALGHNWLWMWAHLVFAVAVLGILAELASRRQRLAPPPSS